MRRFKWIVRCGLLTIGWIAIAAESQIATTDYRRSGDEHFYNLEYDQAIADYTKLIQQDPADPISYNNLARAQLYKEAYRLGLLDSIVLANDNRILRDRHPNADTRAKGLVLDAMERGRRSSETVLERDPRNALALYSLCANYALLATYEYMLENAWFEALRNGARAHRYCDQARKMNPELTDAYLVLGVYQYTAASLPLPVKLFAAIGGLQPLGKSGSKSCDL